MNRKLFLFIISVFLFISFSSCSLRESDVEVIRIKGSDTMLQLTRVLAAEYMSENQNVSIYVEGGGTALGAKALSNNEVSICAASRKLIPSEVRDIAKKQNKLGMAYLIAKDALSVYLNTNNPIDDLSYSALRDIFTCKITRWNELNGDYAEIQKILRPKNSGTYSYFKRYVLETENYCKKNSLTYHTTDEVVYFVAHNRYAIGYGGVAFHDSVKHAKINSVLPTVDNIRNDKYPIIRYLYFYTIDLPQGETKKFIDFVLSEEGQEIVRNSGFVSLW